MKPKIYHVKLIAAGLLTAGALAGIVQIMTPRPVIQPEPVTRDAGPVRFGKDNRTLAEHLEELKRCSVELAKTPEYREMVRKGCEQGLYKCD